MEILILTSDKKYILQI